MPIVTWRHVGEPETYLRGRVPDLNIVFRSDDNGTLVGLVAEGLGVAVVPQLVVNPRNPAYVALPFGNRIPPRHLAIVWHRDRFRSAAAEAFVELAKSLRYRIVQRVGGQYVATTGPMNALRGTAPHVRESHEPSRLSPITKYSFGPRRGHVFVTRVAGVEREIRLVQLLAVDVEEARALRHLLAGKPDHALQVRAALGAELARAGGRMEDRDLVALRIAEPVDDLRDEHAVVERRGAADAGLRAEERRLHRRRRHAERLRDLDLEDEDEEPRDDERDDPFDDRAPHRRRVARGY